MLLIYSVDTISFKFKKLTLEINCNISKLNFNKTKEFLFKQRNDKIFYVRTGYEETHF